MASNRKYENIENEREREKENINVKRRERERNYIQPYIYITIFYI